MKSDLMMAIVWILCAIIWIVLCIQGLLNGKSLNDSLLNITCVILFVGGSIYEIKKYINDKK